MTLPELWHFPVSHYAEKARWALDYKAIPHRRRALFFDYLPRAWWKAGRATIPVLILDGRGIGDSTRIIEALEQRQPEPPLYPSDPAQRERALAIEDFFDEEVGHALRAVIVGSLLERDPELAIELLALGQPERVRRQARAVFPIFRAFYRFRHHITPESREAGRAKVQAGLDRVSAELQPSGYLVGDGFSVADLTAAALLAPLIQPAEVEYAPSIAWPDWAMQYRNSLADHPAFDWVREMYRRHRGKSAEV